MHDIFSIVYVTHKSTDSSKHLIRKNDDEGNKVFTDTLEQQKGKDYRNSAGLDCFSGWHCRSGSEGTRNALLH
jgi:hypothetical protein